MRDVHITVDGVESPSSLCSAPLRQIPNKNVQGKKIRKLEKIEMSAETKTTDKQNESDIKGNLCCDIESNIESTEMNVEVFSYYIVFFTVSY